MSDVERHVIGLALRSQEAFDATMDGGVNEGHFTDPICYEIFLAMLAVDRNGKRPSVSTLGKLSESASAALPHILRDAPVAQAVGFHATELKSAAQVRRSIAAVVAFHDVAKVRAPYESLDVLKAQAESVIEAFMFADDKNSDNARHISEHISPWLENLENRAAGKTPRGIPTGFKGIDLLLNGGWSRGGMYTVAARPGRGKTTFGITTGLAAASEGAKVLFGTVEMPAHDIITKLVSNRSRVRVGGYQSGDLSPEELDRTVFGVEKLSGAPFWIDDQWGGILPKLTASARRLKRRGGLDLVVIDYIGLCRIPGRFNSKYDELGEISRHCKMLARDLDVAVLVLAQLNRKAEDYDIPGLDHIADADNIGRDSDGVILIYRDGTDNSFLSIAKNRWGREAVIPIEADLALNAFRNIDVNWEALRG